MMIVLLNVGFAGLFGFFLSIYYFMYRLNLSNLWRWLGGIVGSLIIGSIMALLDFLMIWPPNDIYTTIIGFTLIILITALLVIGILRTHNLKNSYFKLRSRV